MTAHSTWNPLKHLEYTRSRYISQISFFLRTKIVLVETLSIRNLRGKIVSPSSQRTLPGMLGWRKSIFYSKPCHVFRHLGVLSRRYRNRGFKVARREFKDDLSRHKRSCVVEHDLESLSRTISANGHVHVELCHFIFHNFIF